MTATEQARQEESLLDIAAKLRVSNLTYAFLSGMLDGPEAEKAMEERHHVEKAE